MPAEGTVAVIDWYCRPMKVGPPLRERVASHDVVRKRKRFGFRFETRHGILPYQHVLIFRPKR